jgi:hypothetical protein
MTAALTRGITAARRTLLFVLAFLAVFIIGMSLGHQTRGPSGPDGSPDQTQSQSQSPSQATVYASPSQALAAPEFDVEYDSARFAACYNRGGVVVVPFDRQWEPTHKPHTPACVPASALQPLR